MNVVVLDKRSERSPFSRALTVHARTDPAACERHLAFGRQLHATVLLSTISQSRSHAVTQSRIGRRRHVHAGTAAANGRAKQRRLAARLDPETDHS